MEIELERTFLLKNIPAGLEKCKSIEIIDIYIPKSSKHPILRIRKKGDLFEMTKKYPLLGKDASEQGEYTISLTKEEFKELSEIKGKRFRKMRYFYSYNNKIAEIDIYLDDLKGLVLVDFEFNDREEKDKFKMPNFCLADVTQEKFAAGGILAGKRYSDIEPSLEKYNYKKIKNTVVLKNNQRFVSRKILLIGASILILFIGIGSGYNLKGAPVSLLATLPKSILPIQNKTVQETNNSESYNGAVKVVRVVDGDTIEIEGGEKVRYIGIDTPETVDPRKPVQCFGVEASKKNKEMIEGKMVRLEKDITDRDKYNRLLRYVWVDDAFINLELVKQGFAYSYSYPPDIKYQDQFLKAQQEAREAKRGLWNACPSASKTTEETLAPAGSSASSNTSCQIKGNINASGEKIYHVPGCGSYTKTRIDVSRGERWFCTEAEAQAAGWRKALNCP